MSFKMAIIKSFREYTEKNVTFFHGSDKLLPVGFILKGRGIDYENDYSNTDFYNILEHYRPKDKLSHKDSVFMTDNEDDVSLAGGYENYIYVVEPLGTVERHDVNWSSEISSLVSERDIDASEFDEELEDKIKQAALNYWNGKPHYNESVWEYITPRAKILKLVHIEDEDEMLILKNMGKLSGYNL